MKRFLLFSLLLGVVAFSSCKKDKDDPEPEPISPIVGTWYLSEILITNTPTLYNSFRNLSLSPFYFYILSENLIIKSDNTFIYKANDIYFYLIFSSEGTYVFENNQLVLDPVNDNLVETTYTFNEDGTLSYNSTETVDLSHLSEEDEVIFNASTRWIYRKY